MTKPTTAVKKSHYKDAAAAERALQALELRKAGASYDAIARSCGYATRSGAYQAVQRELQRMMREPTEDVRQLELARLDDLYRAMAPKALRGELQSVDRCLKIMDRRAKLLGLDLQPDSSSNGDVTITITQRHGEQQVTPQLGIGMPRLVESRPA